METGVVALAVEVGEVRSRGGRGEATERDGAALWAVFPRVAPLPQRPTSSELCDGVGPMSAFPHSTSALRGDLRR